ncbi:chromate efflux transporter [Flavihumibacter sp. CACIAM 22H1]|uniref:chromate efflux transporter n=1 Tax=Flavihumibacter sp. CACIAM 22H1 TaxID=1812911 RepID=UPI0007A7E471|nr:chromate efflux transporter [Flavihumibacter sp. CACIAM 22H1]KYP13755.1 MAG: chromate transporter [Flavihumibacter sp. CACIAM 22H1]
MGKNNNSHSSEKKKLGEVFRVFFKLGLLGFGGPAVHIALMEEEVVRKRNWMPQQQFLDLVGATNLIPGPNSTEMTMHCGYERAGTKGLVLAGACFILPAVCITGLIAWAYQQYGSLPQVQPFIYGIKPAVLSIIAMAMLGLGKKAIKSVQLAVIGLLSLLAVLIGFHEILVFFAAGALGVLLYLVKKGTALQGLFPLPFLQVSAAAMDGFNWQVFWVFLKVGAILYGSGYVLFAFLDAELVATGLISRQTLVDAIAVGQFTPGPVFSAATFIGWQLGGIGGAIAATIGIFLPSFLFVALLRPLLPLLQRSGSMRTFLDTVNVVAIAVIAAVLLEMSKESLADWRTMLIGLVGISSSYFFPRLNSAFIVLGGALLGFVLYQF